MNLTRPPLFILSCEHASAAVPTTWHDTLSPDDPVLATHEGYDIGALGLVERLESACGTSCFRGEVTRLLVDLNRSPDNPTRWSRWTRHLAPQAQSTLMARYHAPYWQRLADTVSECLMGDRVVVHLSVHSFTPCLNGEVRDVDVGFLFDPAFDVETRFCRHWKQALDDARPELRVGFNRPYQGASDSITTALRQRWHHRDDYLALEIEVNQRFFTDEVPDWESVADAITATFVATAKAQATR